MIGRLWWMLSDPVGYWRFHCQAKRLAKMMHELGIEFVQFEGFNITKREEN